MDNEQLLWFEWNPYLPFFPKAKSPKRPRSWARGKHVHKRTDIIRRRPLVPRPLAYGDRDGEEDSDDEVEETDYFKDIPSDKSLIEKSISRKGSHSLGETVNNGRLGDANFSVAHDYHIIDTEEENTPVRSQNELCEENISYVSSNLQKVEMESNTQGIVYSDVHIQVQATIVELPYSLQANADVHKIHSENTKASTNDLSMYLSNKNVHENPFTTHTLTVDPRMSTVQKSNMSELKAERLLDITATYDERELNAKSETHPFPPSTSEKDIGEFQYAEVMASKTFPLVNVGQVLGTGETELEEETGSTEGLSSEHQRDPSRTYRDVEEELTSTVEQSLLEEYIFPMDYGSGVATPGLNNKIPEHEEELLRKYQQEEDQAAVLFDIEEDKTNTSHLTEIKPSRPISNVTVGNDATEGDQHLILSNSHTQVTGISVAQCRAFCSSDELSPGAISASGLAVENEPGETNQSTLREGDKQPPDGALPVVRSTSITNTLDDGYSVFDSNLEIVWDKQAEKCSELGPDSRNKNEDYTEGHEHIKIEHSNAGIGGAGDNTSLFANNDSTTQHALVTEESFSCNKDFQSDVLSGGPFNRLVSGQVKIVYTYHDEANIDFSGTTDVPRAPKDAYGDAILTLVRSTEWFTQAFYGYSWMTSTSEDTNVEATLPQEETVVVEVNIKEEILKDNANQQVNSSSTFRRMLQSAKNALGLSTKVVDGQKILEAENQQVNRDKKHKEIQAPEKTTNRVVDEDNARPCDLQKSMHIVVEGSQTQTVVSQSKDGLVNSPCDEDTQANMQVTVNNAVLDNMACEDTSSVVDATLKISGARGATFPNLEKVFDTRIESSANRHVTSPTINDLTHSFSSTEHHVSETDTGKNTEQDITLHVYQPVQLATSAWSHDMRHQVVPPLVDDIERDDKVSLNEVPPDHKLVDVETITSSCEKLMSSHKYESEEHVTPHRKSDSQEEDVPLDKSEDSDDISFKPRGERSIGRLLAYHGDEDGQGAILDGDALQLRNSTSEAGVKHDMKPTSVDVFQRSAGYGKETGDNKQNEHEVAAKTETEVVCAQHLSPTSKPTNDEEDGKTAVREAHGLSKQFVTLQVSAVCKEDSITDEAQFLAGDSFSGTSTGFLINKESTPLDFETLASTFVNVQPPTYVGSLEDADECADEQVQVQSHFFLQKARTESDDVVFDAKNIDSVRGSMSADNGNTKFCTGPDLPISTGESTHSQVGHV